MAKKLDGVLVAEKINQDTAKKVEDLILKGIRVKLAVILVGDNPASELYVKLKKKKAEEIGIKAEIIRLDLNIEEKEVIETIEKLNHDKLTHGIIVQLPLPKKMNTEKVLSVIDPVKDIDGLHPENLGKLLLDNPYVIPPTAGAILEILKEYDIDITGKHVVMVGYGKLVGKPLAAMISLSNKNATLTVCNNATEDLGYYTNQADILISATGVGGLITREMVKEGAIVIDAGTSKVDGKIIGDIEYEDVKKVAGYITPSKGGVGPVTVAKLLQNLVKTIN